MTTINRTSEAGSDVAGVSHHDHGIDAVITADEAKKLRSIRSGVANVLSVYLPIPPDPAELPGLPALAGDLIDAAVTVGDWARRGRLAQRDGPRRCPAVGGGPWPGVARADHGDLRLRAARPARSHAAAWPGCRSGGSGRPAAHPALAGCAAALPQLPGGHRGPEALLAAVGDRAPGGDDRPAGGAGRAQPRSRRLVRPGSQRLQRRMVQLADHHYRSLAAMLEDLQVAGESRPVVVGGQEDCVQRLIHALRPPAVAAVAGSFTADARTLTRARARDLADPVIGRWVAEREHRLADEILGAAPGGRAVIGLTECLAAVNARAADLLLIPDEGLVPGFACGRCSALTVTGSECPDWGTTARPVTDLLDEMAAQVLDDGGQVVVVRALPTVAARTEERHARWLAGRDLRR